jgi:hypothetical protein
MCEESSVIEEPANESKAWLERFEDRLDRVVELLRDLQAGPADNATTAAAEAHVRMRLEALATRLRQRERQRDS